MVLFSMVLESERGLSVWAYKVLTSQEAKELAKPRFESISALRERVDSLFKGPRSLSPPPAMTE